VAINRHLYKGLSYDPERDLAPISLLASAPQLLVAKNDFQDFGSFIRHARQTPVACRTPRSAAAAPPT
jgi:tripartite-type tricarboxylate transporter receptor subunit TctC